MSIILNMLGGLCVPKKSQKFWRRPRTVPRHRDSPERAKRGKARLTVWLSKLGKVCGQWYRQKVSIHLHTQRDRYILPVLVCDKCEEEKVWKLVLLTWTGQWRSWQARQTMRQWRQRQSVPRRHWHNGCYWGDRCCRFVESWSGSWRVCPLAWRLLLLLHHFRPWCCCWRSWPFLWERKEERVFFEGLCVWNLVCDVLVYAQWHIGEEWLLWYKK